jgi:hypothetical protein
MAASDADPFTVTRLAWQALAEHVLAAARHAATGRIGLRPAPGGFATPSFPSGDGPRTVAVAGGELVVVDDRGARRAPITTLRAAGELAEVEPGAPADVYTPSTPLALDAPLVVDGAAAAEIARLFAVVGEALDSLRAEAGAGGADAGAEGEAQLWPEHFDLALVLDEVNYGGSPGDEQHPRPYLYVGPWQPPDPDGGFWNEPFGASTGFSPSTGTDDVAAFFAEGRRRLR